MPRPPRDHSIPAGQILEAIAGVRQTVGVDGLDTISNDWTRVRAIERGFEIISEASRRLPDHLKATEPEIAWTRIAGIGNVIRHDYEGVELALLLKYVSSDFPELDAALRRMLARL